MSRWWRRLLERAGRQAAQVVVPIIAAAQTGSGFPAQAVILAAALAVLLTILKAFAGITATPGSPWPWQLLDRAVPAAAGTILGFVPVDAAGIISVDWARVFTAALSAALVAALAYYITPPTEKVAAGRHVA